MSLNTQFVNKVMRKFLVCYFNPCYEYSLRIQNIHMGL